MMHDSSPTAEGEAVAVGAALPYRATSGRSPSRAQYEAGKRQRKLHTASDMGESALRSRDPVAHLDEQNVSREQELVPLRLERMLANPFTFYRGTAGLMALDLGAEANSGITVAACGDAHLSNFGFYASPERNLVFDLNDFDEAAVAPWEWDLKRLVTSIIVAGQHVGHSPEQIENAARITSRNYRDVMRRLLKSSPVERYFLHLSLDFARKTVSKSSRAALAASVARAQKRTGDRAVRRTTHVDHTGQLRFVHEPPRMTPVTNEQAAQVPALFEAYRSTVDFDVSLVLGQYQPTDVVHRVVGVGSVGTRCFLQLLEGPDGDAFVLQVKEAMPSVLARYGGISQPPAISRGIEASGDGLRVVALQRVLQSVSDPFLGYFRTAESTGRSYYVRQFNDMKGSFDVDEVEYSVFCDYALSCAAVLARAHAQSPAAAAVNGYLGKGNAVIDAITQWSLNYADTSLADYRAVVAAYPEYAPAT